MARAVALQASGRGFESHTLHKTYSGIEDANSKRLLCVLDDTKRYKQFQLNEFDSQISSCVLKRGRLYSKKRVYGVKW